MQALKQISEKLKKSTSPDDAGLYLKLFKKCLTEKHSDGSELWLEDVEQISEIVISESENVQLGNKKCSCNVPIYLCNSIYLLKHFLILNNVNFLCSLYCIGSNKQRIGQK